MRIPDESWPILSWKGRNDFAAPARFVAEVNPERDEEAFRQGSVESLSDFLKGSLHLTGWDRPKILANRY